MSLFDELDNLADGALEKSDALSDSVRRHLRKLLNTRAGSASIHAAYGITDFNDVTREHPSLPDAIAREVAILIRTMEPRLCDVVVTPHANRSSPTSLQFTIIGTLGKKDKHPHQATFELTMGRNRQTVVR